jgi:hypothetical protein
VPETTVETFYAAGFHALVKRWDKCINVGGGFIEKQLFLPCSNLTYFTFYSHLFPIVAQTSVNLKHSLVLVGMFRFKCPSQFVGRYQSVVSCALNMEDLI